jgi:MFS family permease
VSTEGAGNGASTGSLRLGRMDVPLLTGSDRYKWTALFNVTLGVLMATINGSITLIAMPDIIRGIGLDPLLPGNSFYLLWMIPGFLVVTSVLVVNFGRLGDLYGRVKLYNFGFVIFTFFSLLLTNGGAVS